jgi:hypothetical protein
MISPLHLMSELNGRKRTIGTELPVTVVGLMSSVGSVPSTVSEGPNSQ